MCGVRGRGEGGEARAAGAVVAVGRARGVFGVLLGAWAAHLGNPGGAVEVVLPCRRWDVAEAIAALGGGRGEREGWKGLPALSGWNPPWHSGTLRHDTCETCWSAYLCRCGHGCLGSTLESRFLASPPSRGRRSVGQAGATIRPARRPPLSLAVFALSLGPLGAPNCARRRRPTAGGGHKGHLDNCRAQLGRLGAPFAFAETMPWRTWAVRDGWSYLAEEVLAREAHGAHELANNVQLGHPLGVDRRELSLPHQLLQGLLLGGSSGRSWRGSDERRKNAALLWEGWANPATPPVHTTQPQQRHTPTHAQHELLPPCRHSGHWHTAGSARSDAGIHGLGGPRPAPRWRPATGKPPNVARGTLAAGRCFRRWRNCASGRSAPLPALVCAAAGRILGAAHERDALLHGGGPCLQPGACRLREPRAGAGRRVQRRTQHLCSVLPEEPR